jgi:hypothetical protein
MATQGPTQLPAYFSSAADFQNWVTGIHNALSALGLVQTSDTGQINISTVGAPTTSDQSMGYEIWRFNDTLQSSVPVYFKLEYGSGSPDGSGHCPGLWITPGSASNGAGTLIGQVGYRFHSSPSGNKSAGITLPLYGSIAADAADVTLLVNVDTASQSYGIGFSFFRPRDQNGSPTNEGFLAFYWNPNNGNAQYQFVSAIGSIQNIIAQSAPSVNPNFFTLSKNTAGTNACVCPMILPLSGAWRFGKLLLVGQSDFTVGTPFASTLFGVSHTFLPLNNAMAATNNGNNGLSGGSGWAIPWE